MSNILIIHTIELARFGKAAIKLSLIGSESYILTCYRYVELNLVRTNMVEHPAEYPWSSYRYNALGRTNSLINPHSIYLRLGETKAQCCDAYRALFSLHINELSLKEIREATNKSWVLGSEYFKGKIADKLDRPIAPKKRGGDRRSEEFKANK